MAFSFAKGSKKVLVSLSIALPVLFSFALIGDQSYTTLKNANVKEAGEAQTPPSVVQARPVVQKKVAVHHERMPITSKSVHVVKVAHPIAQLANSSALSTQMRGIPILEYHSISVKPGDPYCISPSYFAAEMQHLKQSGYHTISFHDLDNAWYHHGQLPAKPILLTFDDGYQDNYTTAYPILKKYGLKATMFVITGWTKSKHNMSWAEMKEMEQSGLIDIQSHTVDHPDLAKLSAKEQLYEIVESKDMIQKNLPDPVFVFCYPYGLYNQETVKLLKQAGYEFATTGNHGYAESSQGALTLDRVHISANETPSMFARQFV